MRETHCMDGRIVFVGAWSTCSYRDRRGPSLQVALIDSTTGDILWANTAVTAGGFEDSGLDTMVKQLLTGFPSKEWSPSGV